MIARLEGMIAVTSAPAFSEFAFVVGVDGSAQSLEAVDWAAAEADTHSCRLMVCHVRYIEVPMATPMASAVAAQTAANADQVVDAAVARARAARPDLTVQGSVRYGSPAWELARLAGDAGTVVVGHRGLGGFSELLLGSVGAQAAAHARGPAVIVRPATRPDGPVLIGVDGGHDPHRALEYGFDHAERHGRAVQVLHAFHDPLAVHGGLAARLPETDRGHGRQAAEQHLTDAIPSWREKYPDVPVELIALGAPATHALTDASSGCSLLVVGRRGPGGLAGMLLGCVSQTVIRHAHSTVAVVG
jgi:nucleotide-binding universal stress UspA family protein